MTGSVSSGEKINSFNIYASYQWFRGLARRICRGLLPAQQYIQCFFTFNRQGQAVRSRVDVSRGHSDVRMSHQLDDFKLIGARLREFGCKRVAEGIQHKVCWPVCRLAQFGMQVIQSAAGVMSAFSSREKENGIRP